MDGVDYKGDNERIETALKALVSPDETKQLKTRVKLLEDESPSFIDWFRKSNKRISNHGSRIKLDTVLNKLV